MIENMTDKELIELAAKAAGVNLRDNIFTHWNPLSDNDTALMLAVNMRITIKAFPWYELAICHRMGSRNPTEVVEKYNNDPMAATRRAIVRCAALIGPNAKLTERPVG